MKNQIILSGVELLAEVPILDTMHNRIIRNRCEHLRKHNLRRQGNGLIAVAQEFQLGRMLRIIICMAYLILLTTLLLTPNPSVVVGLKRIPVFPWGGNGIHCCAFAMFSVLVHGMRWPKSCHWLSIVLLLGFGATTETLQTFIPPRTVELKDYLENFIGVAAGTGIYWMLHRMWQVLCMKRKITVKRRIDIAAPRPRPCRSAAIAAVC